MAKIENKLKTLILVRHAKSSWHDLSISDFDRKLDDRGKRDAPVMASRLLHADIKIDAFVSSPAKRAVKTAKIFMKTYDAAKDLLTLQPKIYEASLQTLMTIIEDLDNRWSNVALFGHNPGISDLANYFKGHNMISMPTCAFFGVKFDVDKWEEFRIAEPQYFLYDFPKNQ